MLSAKQFLEHNPKGRKAHLWIRDLKVFQVTDVLKLLCPGENVVKSHVLPEYLICNYHKPQKYLTVCHNNQNIWRKLEDGPLARTKSQKTRSF